MLLVYGAATEEAEASYREILAQWQAALLQPARVPGSLATAEATLSCTTQFNKIADGAATLRFQFSRASRYLTRWALAQTRRRWRGRRRLAF